MNLVQLSLVNFKNYAQAEVQFSPGINCLLGENGEGKTNVLDAIHILSFCKSYFNPIDSHSIKFDEEFYMVQGEFNKDSSSDQITCSVKKGRKKAFLRNKSEYEKLADHIGQYPVVMITPYDVNLVLGGSDVRRKFMDTIISQFNRHYLSDLIAYNRVLEQRNAFLKQSQPGADLNMEMLDVFDGQLVSYGTRIHALRKAFIEDAFKTVFSNMHERISGGKEQVELRYLSQVSEAAYEGKLKEALQKDKSTQYTNVGIHKDDLSFEIAGHPLKKFGSQGQQKSYLLGLKLAYYNCLKTELGIAPLLLLDDVFDKLDQKRVMALLNIVVEGGFSQVFITDTSPQRVPGILEELEVGFKTFEVKEGGVYEAG